MRLKVVTRVACLAQLILLVALCAVTSAQNPVLDPLLQAKATLLTGQSRVVVVARDGVSLTALTLVIQGLGGTPGRLLPIINARAATLPNTALAALAANSAVQHASLDRLIVLRVLDGSGGGRISDVIAALDYVVGHQAELNIRVVNLSVATGVYESYKTDPLTVAAKRAVDAGIVVVAAAGNNGRGSQGQT